MLFSKVLIIPLLILVCLLHQAASQFPSACNNFFSLRDRRCCPNNCGGTTRGRCSSITNIVNSQTSNADECILSILSTTAQVPQKGTIDSRYLWPTIVFNQVCVCNGNYYGADCTQCAYGWTGDDCSTRKTPVVRKSFGSLTDSEKRQVVNGLRLLKHEMGYWSVIVHEPQSFSERVTLQEVSTYDYLIYIHQYSARDASAACVHLNGDIVDFAHSGPNFPVWHRTYLLILERAMQRVLNDSNFGFPYWKWESNDKSEVYSNYFNNDFFGQLAPEQSSNEKPISGGLIDSNWTTICGVAIRDGRYFTENRLNLCKPFWKLCNPQRDLEEKRLLKRGYEGSYLPHPREIQIAIAAPEYDRANSVDKFEQNSPRASFRSRLEGWNLMCSASNCVGRQLSSKYQRLHNIVHDWIAGHMGVPAPAVNDPIFSLHHTNIDRILESWMMRFNATNQPIPEYVPISGGHPGHNRDDYMVPFFPLITPGQQYRPAEYWGYTYDEIINSTLNDGDIPDCDHTEASISQCYICASNGSCYSFDGGEYSVSEECPAEYKERCSNAGATLKTNHTLFLLVTLFSLVSGNLKL